LKIEKMGTN